MRGAWVRYRSPPFWAAAAGGLRPPRCLDRPAIENAASRAHTPCVFLFAFLMDAAAGFWQIARHERRSRAQCIAVVMSLEAAIILWFVVGTPALLAFAPLTLALVSRTARTRRHPARPCAPAL